MTSLSVVIPALNEAAVIGRVIERARLGRPHEIIVVDGGSEDATVAEAASHGARVLSSPPGRGVQMGLGAAAATGRVLLFLHADTLLPPRYQRHVMRILDRHGVVAGAMRLRIDGPGRILRLIERAVAHRSARRQRPYGDQTLFLLREVYESVGGYRPIAIMEDVDLVRRLRRRGRIGVSPAAVTTSARRWLQRGAIRTTLANQACLAAFGLGVAPDRIARWRRGRSLVLHLRDDAKTQRGKVRTGGAGVPVS